MPKIFLLFRQLFGFIKLRRKLDILLAFLLMIFSGISEVLTIASIIPFMSYLLDDSGQISTHVIGNLPVLPLFSSIWAVGGLLIGAVIVSVLLRLANSWWLIRITALIGVEIGSAVYEKTLYRPYVEHTALNSGELISLMSLQVDRTVVVIREFLQILVSLTTALSIVLALLAIDLRVSLVLFSVFGISYAFVAYLAKKRLSKNGHIVAIKSGEKIKALQEGLGAIRDVILDNTQKVYVEAFKKADNPLRLANAESSFLSLFPRYFIEGTALILVILLTISLSLGGVDARSFFPILSAFALGAQKLLPSLQQIYGSWAGISSMQASFEAVIASLQQPTNLIISGPVDPWRWGNSIELANVSYRHRLSSVFTINTINLQISKGEKIGFFGATGSGKSTLIDLIMGLLTPSNGGCVMVDSVPIHNSLKPELLLSWQRTISHVPQAIFLSDGTIEQNIAFGQPDEVIDCNKVRKSAEMAQIASFIESQPEGYKTKVGERGIRLSGGQRQRIGIARAFYKSADVLILDEATSALDEFTEDQVIRSIYSSLPNSTVIMIAHRLSTLRSCDRVFEIKDGALVKEMTGNEMFANYQRKTL